MTKSVAGTLVGIAQDDGDLRIGERASKWIPQWRGTQSAAVTVRNLLSMDSGREWSPLTDYLGLLAAPDRTAFAIGLGQDAAPGTSGRTTTRPCRRSTPCWRKRPARTRRPSPSGACSGLSA